MIADAARRIASLLLAGALLLPGQAVAGESETVAVHIIPGQFLRMIPGQKTVAEVRLLAVVTNHGRRAVRFVSSSCRAVGAESEAQLAAASELAGPPCRIDPPPPWELHPAKQQRIGIIWPVRPQERPSDAPRAAPGSAYDLQFAGLRVWRSAVHDKQQDELRLLLILEDGSEATSEGFHLLPFAHTPRFTRYHYGYGTR